MGAIKRILILLLFLFSAMTIFCYVGFRLGYDGLLLIGEIVLPDWVLQPVFILVFSAQLILMGVFSINEYTRKGLLLMIPCVVGCSVLGCILSDNLTFIATGILPYTYFIALGIWRKDIKLTLARTIGFYLLVAVYQYLSLLIKTSNFVLGYNRLTNYEWFLWSLDLMLFIFVIFSIGGVRNGKTVECYLCSEDIEFAREDSDDRESIRQFQKLIGFRKLAAMSILIGFQVVQWIIILSVCYMGDVFLEGLTITTSFIANGFIIKRRWHSKSLVVCTLSSIAMFYISAKIIIAFEHTQFFPILVGAALIYSLYRVSKLIDIEAIRKNELYVLRLKRIEDKMNEAWSKIDKISDSL